MRGCGGLHRDAWQIEGKIAEWSSIVKPILIIQGPPGRAGWRGRPPRAARLFKVHPATVSRLLAREPKWTSTHRTRAT